MAAATQASPLLALPFELRTKVYEQLLRPDPDRVHTLYHDRHGREASFDFDPTILRVNKQIYSEAVSILYDTTNVRIHLATPVIMQCTGGNYPDHIVDPPDLFRKDAKGAVEPANRLDWRTTPSIVKELEIEGRLESTAHGFIYPHCFQRLHKIQLVTSRHAIWGDGECRSYFSHTGKTVLRILKLLAEEQATKPSMTKRLRFTIQPDWRTVESELLMRNGKMDNKTKVIVGLLKALERKTDAEIEVEEGGFKKTLRELKMEEVDVDEWEKVLLADADIDL
ncbi:hypothetical protein HO133_011029 [Letharia lupina]|uniref:Uncharacterized protein n=1 Tax=Letharia lupina TaxID=560253 RepID=A0A8H6FDG1_9LECA|nr:uncharacterized protein HO133_011029 [Letharia lupina]KAF6224452.1 hypothetical protein HO133_011029 [Letharia lupina]